MPSAVAEPTPSTLIDDDYRRIPLQQLKSGQILTFPIRTSDGVLLLAEGSEITPRILGILQQRGYSTVLVNRREPSIATLLEPTGSIMDVPADWPGAVVGVHNRATRQLDYELSERLHAANSFEESPLLQDIPRIGAIPYSAKLAQEIFQKHESFVDELRDSVRQVVQRNPSGEEHAASLVKEYLNLLVEDIDLFSNCASAPCNNTYPYRHSLHVAMMSLAMGVRAGFGEEQLRRLGLGALLHDIGMLRIPKSIRTTTLALTAQQQLAIMAHPIYSVEALGQIESIPADVRYIVYQTHERSGGQGYPRRIPSDLIHPLAKIVATADMYVAMLSDRPHRAAIQPYAAVESLIRAVRAGRLDAQPVRLLLETVALYPVGSYVLLSNGQLGKVLRSNGSLYDRPVIRTWPPRTQPSEDSGELLDLASTQDIRVVEAIPSPMAAN